MAGLNIGMVGTRFAGLDGVTLESIKVARVLESMGHSVQWFAGKLDPEFKPGVEVVDAFFDTVANQELSDHLFGIDVCDPATLETIEERATSLQESLGAFVADHRVDVLMPQNALAIPMQVPLGVAISRFAAVSGIPVLAHHHDLAWERTRFWPNGIGEYLAEAFPPTGPRIGHLVINSIARAELERRKGVLSRVLPNIMDFSSPPAGGDGLAFRRLAGLDSNDRVILQPTRMVPRKGIEDTLELARRLDDDRVTVVVTHPEPDEGVEYVERLEEAAVRLGVDFRIVPIDPPVTLEDAYAAADLVAYPSRIEGFGNALLEAFYFRCPLLVNRYPVYEADIAPEGVMAIEMENTISDEVVAAARRWLDHPELWVEAVAHNYKIGRRSFSYEKAAEVLNSGLNDIR